MSYPIEVLKRENPAMSDLESATPHRTPLAVHAHAPHMQPSCFQLIAMQMATRCPYEGSTEIVRVAAPNRKLNAVGQWTPQGSAISALIRRRDIVTETCQVTTSLPMKDVCHSSSSPRACRAHLRITAGGDGVLYAVHGVTSQISAVVNSVRYICTVLQVCLLEVGPETTTAPATCSVTSRGLRRGASCRRHDGDVITNSLSPLLLDICDSNPCAFCFGFEGTGKFSLWGTGADNDGKSGIYMCMEDSGKGSRQATRDALLVAGGYSKCKYFNSVYLFGMKMNRWSEGPSVSQFRPYAGTALPL
ncbi:hypothetical protein EVAR_69058_1 [Eumeta japonica]|uniref:Uncharacterized protein n=1 Tax=Eumeta variegata TaxID=151549 RepID=A0A4C1ZFH2_EUMVA|nr:hypothetical protein EVAR_69058_1 [Eumeta japonica]